ncbi:TPA: hypothetical protein N0F65_006303 [Lagenidium giganteum]|uniref:Uncharacterized protein n=1 Tax=Lagenidium giganteum TaxID=4803 RepID=A0AAV2YQ02_9STRA|nr:TPA: hypothetical protein N0F65_006303 [Lagenidium giganteum]
MDRQWIAKLVAAVAAVGAWRRCCCCCFAEAAASSAPAAAPFTANDVDNAVYAALDPDRWGDYEAFVLDRSRRRPLLALFTSDARVPCASQQDETSATAALLSNDDNDDDVWIDGLFPIATSGDTDAISMCTSTPNKIASEVVAALQTKVFKNTAYIHFVRLLRETNARAFDYHRIPPSTSAGVMCIPPRSRRFQRYAHIPSNFFDLSATALGDRPEADVRADLVQFVRACVVRNGGRWEPQTDATAQALDRQLAAAESSSSSGLVPPLAFALMAWIILVNRWRRIVAALRTRALWHGIVQGIVYVALSGVFNSIIHGMPPFYFHPNHGLLLVHPSGRRQFLLEGLVHGSWSFVVSLGLLCVTEVLPRIKARNVKEDVMHFSLIGIIVSYCILYFTYLSKNRWMAQ